MGTVRRASVPMGTVRRASVPMETVRRADARGQVPVHPLQADREVLAHVTTDAEETASARTVRPAAADREQDVRQPVPWTWA